jgi:transcriptional regulator with PAS, ATPase and Fis domain
MMISFPALEQFLDNLEEGILFLDRDRQVITINAAAVRMLGKVRGDIVDHLCPSLFQGSPCARTCETSGRCSLMHGEMQEKLMQDLVVQRPDGELTPLRMWAMLMPFADSPAYCAVVLRDRTHEVQLEEAASERMQLGGLVGHSGAMQELFRQILRVAASEASILITGESGTGKELVARALHDNSSRVHGPYVRVHCAAFPEHLLEAELFGHARGAFTGAVTAREGRFEAAHGGTLLLDEIGEVPLNVQVKLLRVLQEHEIERLGENQPRKVDVRIIAATHRDLAGMVQRGEFRADLYYRLRVLPLHVPPLRERRDDIPLLVSALLAHRQTRQPGDVQVSPETLEALCTYAWPGNVRELANALEYAVVQAEGGIVQPRHLLPEIQVGGERATSPSPVLVQRYYRAPRQTNTINERALLLDMLAQNNGNRAATATQLGMSRTTLWKKLKQHGIDGPAG